MGEWQTKRLGDVVKLRRGFDLPSRERLHGRYPVLSAGITAGWHSVAAVDGPGFVVGRVTNLGTPTWSDTAFWPLNTTMYAADFKGNVPKFLYYLFESLDLTGYDSGSVQPVLNRNYIADVEVVVPDVPTQQAISDVLSALEAKIAANRHLFVKCERLMVATVASISAEVPLSDLASHSPQTVKPANFDEKSAHFSLPAYDAGAQPEIVAGSTIKSNKFVLAGPCVLFSKLNPHIPRIWNVAKIPPQMALASTEFVVLEPTDVDASALWSALGQPDVSETVQQMVAGTSGSHQRIRPGDLMNVAVRDVRRLSTDHASLIAALGTACVGVRAESATLTQTRNELLPLLVSGTVTVSELEGSARSGWY